MAEIATQIPQTKEALGQLRALPRGMGNSRQGDGLLKAIKDGLARDPETLPHANWGRDDTSEAVQAAAEILKLALKIVCEREGLAPKLMANTSDIEAVAESDDADVPLMHGWRREVFGNVALELKHGRAMIGFRDGRAVIIQSQP